MHLLVAVGYGYEIPLIPEITAANTNDMIQMIPLVKRNLNLLPSIKPKYILGDKGYDSKANYKAIVEDIGAVPIIDMNMRGRKGKTNRLEDIADEKGNPICAFGIPYEFEAYDEQTKKLKYRCPLAVGKPGCKWIEKCEKFVEKIEMLIPLKDDYRRFIEVPRHIKKWKKIYNKRVSVERTFSTLKKDGNGKLVKPKVRGLEKITLNCLLSVLTLQAKKASLA